MRRFAFRSLGDTHELHLVEDQVAPGPGEVVIDIAGCALAPEENLPGRAISGWVAAEGAGVSGWLDRPALGLCGTAESGLASHAVLPAAGLVSVPDALEEKLPELAALVHPTSGIASLLATHEIAFGQLVLFIGASDLAGFGLQLASAAGAVSLAVDTDTPLLMNLFGCGARGVLDGGSFDGDVALQADALRGLAARCGAPETGWRAFGQPGDALGRLASQLGATPVPLTGQPPDPGQLRDLLGLVETGRLDVAPFVAPVPMSRINQLLGAIGERQLKQQPILVPDFPT